MITLGRNGKREHLRANDRLLEQMKVEFHATIAAATSPIMAPGKLSATRFSI